MATATHSHPLLAAMFISKPPSSVEESLANMSAQIEKLVAAFAGIQATQETLEGDHSHLTVAVNRLQSEKIGDLTSCTLAPNYDKFSTSDTTDAITHAAKHGHKLFSPHMMARRTRSHD
jgi:hypothetical protein